MTNKNCLSCHFYNFNKCTILKEPATGRLKNKACSFSLSDEEYNEKERKAAEKLISYANTKYGKSILAAILTKYPATESQLVKAGYKETVQAVKKAL